MQRPEWVAEGTSSHIRANSPALVDSRAVSNSPALPERRMVAV
jgi:hypothetical protein